MRSALLRRRSLNESGSEGNNDTGVVRFSSTLDALRPFSFSRTLGILGGTTAYRILSLSTST
jgi:hypothetical protein